MAVLLLVRGVEDGIVQAHKKRAGAHGRSAEAGQRASLAELLASMADMGLEADFPRQDDNAATPDVLS